MLSPHETLRWIVERITHVYARPLVYAENAGSLDLVLHYYHELMAEVAGEAATYRALEEEAYRREDCGSADFSTAFRLRNPGADERQVAAYCVAQWRQITDGLVATRAFREALSTGAQPNAPADGA